MNLKYLKEYWFLIAFVGTTIFAWATVQAKVGTLESAMLEVRQEQKSIPAAIEAINGLKASVDYLRNDIRDLRKDFKRP